MRVFPLLKDTFPILAIMQVAILCTAAGVAARDYTVALVQFRMNADENIVYIENGVRDMIVSRISYNTPITVIEQGLVGDELTSLSVRELTRENLLTVGSALQADFVIGGSISKMGNNVSIDVTIINVGKGGATSSVFAQSIGLDELIPHMKVLSQEIADTISREGETGVQKTTTPQPPEGAETGFEEEVQGGKKADEKPLDPGSSEDDTPLETIAPAADEAKSEMEKNPESPETIESPSGELLERLMQREREIDDLGENPAYQKSIDDLEKASENTGEESSDE